MFLPMFFGAAAVFALFAVLAVKIKKARVPMTVLAVVALLPTLVLGMISVGAGGIIHYPGDPAAAVEGMVTELCDLEYEAADDYVMGSLGLNIREIDGETVHLLDLMSMYWSVSCGEPVYEEFTARLPVKLTALDTEGWLTGLAAEAEAVLAETVESSPAKELYNEERTAYLDGITEQAYQTAYGRLWGKGEEYLHTVDVDVTLSWRPNGWKIVLDEALISALEGYALGDDSVTVRNGEMAVRLANRMHTAHTDIVDGLPLLYKTYQIPIDALSAPKPDPNGFGSTDDPNEVLAVIERAAHLVGDRKISWNPDIVITPGSKINYYYDESILAIQWKESRDGALATFGEVIIKDGSQIRRCISGDSFRNFNYETPTQMSQRTNAVLGMTGDFYMFRGCGIMAYQGQVYRSDPSSLAHLFVTNSGDLLMTESYGISAGQAAKFVADNDVSFSMAFGPIIVENGEKLPQPVYIIGEFNSNYPRAAIGQVDPLHYIVMTVGRGEGSDDRTVTLAEAQQYIWEKGVEKAYNLDGGRTANMTFNGTLTTDPAYAKERTLSDIFYFASAVPEDER